MTAPDSRRRPPTWPVIPLALPAAVSIWAGWVGLGQLTGFGVVQLLPGIWDGLRINTAVTLPIGMEAYAAYALYVWLHKGTPRRARDFARVSSILALTLGALGQVAFHLMAASGVESAPWPITAAVACLPVAVLGMGCALAHLLSTEPDDEPGNETRNSAEFTEPPMATPLQERRSAQTQPPFRPAMSAPPVGNVRADIPDRDAQPVAPVRPDPVPSVRPAFAPAVRPADRSGGQSPERPAVRPADRSAGSNRNGPADRSGTSARNGPARKRAGKPRTDEQIVAAAREQATASGEPPSQYQLKQQFGIGSSRASRLLAELDDLTPAGEPGHNGTARKEGTR